MLKINITLFSLIMISVITCKAQNFAYSLSSDSSSYSELSQPTLLSDGSDWSNKRFELPIGFTFNFLGQNFDSLTIEGNGFLIFDKNKNYSIVTFKGAQCKRDSNNAFSSISYKLSGNNGSHILKIQFEKTGFISNNTSEVFNYQIWLYEQTGNIKFHVGPNTNSLYAEDLTTTLLGLINSNQNTEVKAYLATGFPSSASGHSINLNDNLEYLIAIPFEGKAFTFSPQ